MPPDNQTTCWIGALFFVGTTCRSLHINELPKLGKLCSHFLRSVDLFVGKKDPGLRISHGFSRAAWD